VTRELLKKASEIGIANVDVPEQYAAPTWIKSAPPSLPTASPIRQLQRYLWRHVGIGTLPIVFFGTEDQKKKYLPKLASGEWIGAYALSESTSGSDALNCRTKQCSR